MGLSFGKRGPWRGILTGLCALGAAGVLAACGGDEDSDGALATEGEALQVTTTTNWITDTAERIGGDRVEVTGLMGAGVDPHLYQARSSDVDTLRDTDVVFWNGLDLEAQMEEVFEQIGEEKPVVAVGEAVPEDSRLRNADEAFEFDPHVWFDPQRWEHVAEAMAATYAEADPAGADEYAANLEAFRAELEEIDAYTESRLADIPPESRVLVTSHDAFSYFADAYDFEVVAIQGISTEGEATTADVERVAQVIVDRDLNAVFVESSVPRQTIEAVLAAAAADGQEAEIGGELFGDNSGDAGTDGGTYAGALRVNTDLIAAGLS